MSEANGVPREGIPTSDSTSIHKKETDLSQLDFLVSLDASNVAQTENTIQNIILEEMERLDGILIATTNMADNLDGAFERRFLFKIKYDKPTLEARKNIWLTKMPKLSEDDAQILANAFAFSGGEIDNIVRKSTIMEVLNGAEPDLQSLKRLCKEEKMHGDNVRIGFS